MKKYMVGIFLLASLFGVGISPALAQDATSISTSYSDIQEQGLIFAGICDSATSSCDCRDYGKCTLSDMLQLLVNLSVFIFGISGSVMLLVLVYGGLQWILAHGDPAKVTAGREAILGALIGLVVILGAYVAVNVIVSVLKTGEIPTETLEETIGEDADGVIQTE